MPDWLVRAAAEVTCNATGTVPAWRLGKMAERTHLITIRICTLHGQPMYLQPLALSSICEAVLPICRPGGQLVAAVVDEAVNDAGNRQDTADDRTR